jgi:hypothetical protein
MEEHAAIMSSYSEYMKGNGNVCSLTGWGQPLNGKRGKNKCFEEDNGINLFSNFPL